MFKIGDKVKVTGNDDDYIWGIYNHMTDKMFYDTFGRYLLLSHHWNKHLEGEIFLIGKNNNFVIKSGDKYYCLHNDFKEMEIA